MPRVGPSEAGIAAGYAPRVQVEEIQRSRLLVAAVAAIDELGYEQTSVQEITRRARVSRRTFYELFGNREACLVALLDEVVGRVERELTAAHLDGLAWRERVRGGLWTILSFLDAEPALARICVVEALHGGPLALERRERILARLAAVLDEGRLGGVRGDECTLVTAEGLVGGALGVVYARLRSGGVEPLAGLLDELMAMIALQYLGPRAARREQQRPAPAPRPVSRGPGGCGERGWRAGSVGRSPDASDLPYGAGVGVCRGAAGSRVTARSRTARGSQTRGRSRSFCGAWRVSGCSPMPGRVT